MKRGFIAFALVLLGSVSYATVFGGAQETPRRVTLPRLRPLNKYPSMTPKRAEAGRPDRVSIRACARLKGSGEALTGVPVTFTLAGLEKPRVLKGSGCATFSGIARGTYWISGTAPGYRVCRASRVRIPFHPKRIYEVAVIFAKIPSSPPPKAAGRKKQPPAAPEKKIEKPPPPPVVVEKEKEPERAAPEPPPPREAEPPVRLEPIPDPLEIPMQFPSPEPFEGDMLEPLSPVEKAKPGGALEAIEEFRRSHGSPPLYEEEENLME